MSLKFKIVGDSNDFEVYYSTVGEAPSLQSINTEVVIADGRKSYLSQLKITPKNGSTLDGVVCDKTGFDPIFEVMKWNWQKSGDDYICAVNDSAHWNGVLATTTVSSTPGVVSDPEVVFKVTGNGNAFSLWRYQGDTAIEELDLDVEHAIAKSDRGVGLNLRLIPKDGGTITSATCDEEYFDVVLEEYRWKWVEVSGTFKVVINDDWYYNDTLATTEVSAIPGSSELITPMNQLFFLNDEDQEALSEELSMLYNTGDNDPDPTLVNAPGFVINIVKYPFALPDDIHGTDEFIRIGTHLTPVKAPYLETDTVTIELGDIEVEDLEGTSFDYAGCVYELVLPFVEKPIKLEPSWTVGKTINVKYEIDIYSGDMSINVFSDGELMLTQDDRIGRTVPFRLFEKVENNLGRFVGTNNGLMKAYIRVTRVEVGGGDFDNLVTVNGVLGDSLGYVEVVNAMLNAVPRSREVLALLREGVIIK